MRIDSIFLSTLSLRRATTRFKSGLGNRNISIHALLAESDSTVESCSVCSSNFYPRSPCGERLLCFGVPSRHQSISIHALLAESDQPHVFVGQGNGISIHALLAESDLGAIQPDAELYISIHALLAESDLNRPAPLASRTNFYPRSPCGERPEIHQSQV